MVETLVYNIFKCSCLQKTVKIDQFSVIETKFLSALYD